MFTTPLDIGGIPGIGAEILRRLYTDDQFKQVLTYLEINEPLTVVSGLTANGAKALALAALNKLTGRRLVYLSLDDDLGPFAEEVGFFTRLFGDPHGVNSSVVVLPSFEVSPYQAVSPHPATLQRRAATLLSLNRNESHIALLHYQSLLTKTIKPDEIAGLSLELVAGQVTSQEELVELLTATGYVNEDPVMSVGDFSVRGGIVDVFSPAEQHPVRVEFFGDQVESIRTFDADTQRSINRVARARILPLREFALAKGDLTEWSARARNQWTRSAYEFDLERATSAAVEGETFQGWEFQLPLIRPFEATVFDFLKGSIFVIDDPAAISAEVREFYRRIEDECQSAHDNGRLALEPSHYFLDQNEIALLLKQHQRLEIHPLGQTVAVHDVGFAVGEELHPGAAPNETSEFDETSRAHFAPAVWDLDAAHYAPEIEIDTQSVRKHQGNLAEAIDELNRALRRGTLTVIVARSKGMVDRFVEVLSEHGISVETQSSTTSSTVPPHARRPVHISVGKVRHGFELPTAAMRFVSQGDILAEEHLEALAIEHLAKQRAAISAFLSDFRDLKPGDFVVHIDHGIGQFQGLIKLQSDGQAEREYMHVAYAEGANLYVPIERLDLVQKYSSADAATPTLDRLGSQAWQRAKTRAHRALRDMAEELLRVQAARKLVGGHAFNSDTPWQKEFEAGFEYELTPDQEKAVEEIKQDMEQAIPMDRLLCGDVGFGKTEVAMRAAFKAVMDGKQVAVLVPTTILADQHHRTFTERFGAFPIKVGLLSRFLNRKEEKRVVQECEEGSVDLVIGTHRLLSKDVKFRDLGLVVVDEEQRFGVTHKERLKQLKKKVDVLTLTATPIPRTLNMALMGLREMSVIETPPHDRLAVQTIVAQFAHGIIKNAVERELERDGQVFFVHNSIDSIYTMADLVRRLVPQARVGVTHGALSERELEKTMMQFVRRELDVLATTTIIENGIDIPLANTIIINHADRFGLSELYQLRGRVGRSNRRAYAYLLIPPESNLSRIARRRLAALKEFSFLGAGFRLAALDLELRGAGNVLGAEQSGHIKAIGFELYCQMLESTIRELSGEQLEEEINTQVNVRADIRIPEEYVPDMGQRLRLYKRISSTKDEKRLAEIRDELLDRFGQLPPSVENLLDYSLLRNEAAALRVQSIDHNRDQCAIKFDANAQVNPEKLVALTTSRENVSLSPDGVLSLQVTSESGEMLKELRNLLLELRSPA
jgi:transcription-repair coupling factor (superfamily II helicase)